MRKFASLVAALVFTSACATTTASAASGPYSPQPNPSHGRTCNTWHGKTTCASPKQPIKKTTHCTLGVHSISGGGDTYQTIRVTVTNLKSAPCALPEFPTITGFHRLGGGTRWPLVTPHVGHANRVTLRKGQQAIFTVVTNTDGPYIDDLGMFASWPGNRFYIGDLGSYGNRVKVYPFTLVAAHKGQPKPLTVQQCRAEWPNHVPAWAHQQRLTRADWNAFCNMSSRSSR